MIERFEAVKVAESPRAGMNNNSPKPGHGNYLGEPELQVLNCQSYVWIIMCFMQTTEQTVHCAPILEDLED